MQKNFNKFVKYVLDSEGGYVDDPHDNGGATNLGITIGTARRYGLDVDGDGDVDKIDVKNLTRKDAKKVYREGYWNPVKASLLLSGVDYATADWAINSGPTRAIIGLQRSVGVADDGIIGPITLRAAREQNPVETIENMAREREQFYRSLSDFRHFGNGWLNRNARVRRRALAMSKEANNGAPTPKPVPEKYNRDDMSLLEIIIQALKTFFTKKG